jgi:enamine deaminase RidA (YjgF/YER057c/UK114 family)
VVYRDAAGNRHVRIADIRPGGDAPPSFEAQARGCFSRAAELLRAAGSSFRSVARTWIFLREMERDYHTLNRVRREFFAAERVTLLPASTGVGAAPGSGGADISICLYAFEHSGGGESNGNGRVAPLRATTLNEAAEYGAFFSRGVELRAAGPALLYLSGTAAVDQSGRSVGDRLETQARRMLENVEALLGSRGAAVADVVHAVSYLKYAGDASRYRAVLRESGLLAVPHPVVEAEICRSELLCEIEVVAQAPPPARSTH